MTGLGCLVSIKCRREITMKRSEVLKHSFNLSKEIDTVFSHMREAGWKELSQQLETIEGHYTAIFRGDLCLVVETKRRIAETLLRIALVRKRDLKTWKSHFSNLRM